MLDLVRKYKTVLTFIATFVGSYLLLAFLYGIYLKFGASVTYYPDFVTHIVAEQTEWLVSKMGYDTQIVPNQYEPSMNISINGDVIVRVIEGCNAVSIMLLFTSFVLAFFRGWSKTLRFVGLGILLLYVMNVARIAILTVLMYEYPEYSDVLHDVLFPAVIYGTVVLLWMYWIKGYSPKKSTNE